MQVKKQQLELGMEQQTGSKCEKEYIKAVYCHPAYLTYMHHPLLYLHLGREAGLLSVLFSQSLYLLSVKDDGLDHQTSTFPSHLWISAQIAK